MGRCFGMRSDGQARQGVLCWVGLFATACLLSACSATGALNALSSRSSYTMTNGLSYGSHVRQRLDVYVPTTPRPTAGWPMVVFFYGGSWRTGDRASYRFVAEALAARGVLTVIADYRLYPEVRYPEFLQDGAQALAYGIENAERWGGDRSRVFVMGHSAGAYIAAMLALDDRWLAGRGHRRDELAGWIGLAGPYDFLPSENPDVQPVFFHPHYPSQAQPIEFATSGAPRSFLGAAVEDSLVSPERSTKQLAGRLEAAGTAVTLRLYDHASHVTLIGAFAWPLRWIAPVLQDVQTFIAPSP